MWKAAGVVGVAALLMVGCEEKRTPAAQSSSRGTAAVETGASGGEEKESKDLKFENVQVRVPERWRRIPVEGISRRVAYEVPGEAEVEFTASIDGVLASRDRLANQYSGAAEPKFEMREIDGTEVTIIKASGTYKQGNQPPRENWGLRAAIADTPIGLVFIEMRGPAEAVEAATDDFDEMVGSMRVEK